MSSVIFAACYELVLSMKNLLFVTAMFVSFGISFLYADEKPLFAPRPAKDSVAIKNRAQGAEIFEMIIDKSSGKIKEVYVRSSTKNVLLDADVINTFLQWRFKPNTESSIKVVVLFTADKDEVLYPVGHTMHATNRGIPYAFKEPIAPAKLWQWFSELYGAAGHR